MGEALAERMGEALAERMGEALAERMGELGDVRPTDALAVRPSVIPGAGLGLFASTPFSEVGSELTAFCTALLFARRVYLPRVLRPRVPSRLPRCIHRRAMRSVRTLEAAYLVPAKPCA
jgi:hypothetical protein